MGSIPQQTPTIRGSWLRGGIASPGNFALLLATFALFPIVGRWTGAFAFGSISIDSPLHTQAIVRFFLFLLVFEWAWFFIAWVGIRRFGRITFAELVGGRWNRASRVFLDVGIALGVLVVMLVLGTVLQRFLSRFETSSAPLRSMVPQNALEASAFLAAAHRGFRRGVRVSRILAETTHCLERERGPRLSLADSALHPGPLFSRIDSADSCRRVWIAAYASRAVAQEPETRHDRPRFG